MISKKKCRLLLATVPAVVLLLAPAPAQAGGIGGLETLRAWLLSWTFGQSDSGPTIDPNGGNGSTSATGQSDQGPAIDPNGGNGSTSATGQSDSGPTIDPLGGPR